MKTTSRIITVSLIVLAAASLFVVNPLVAGEPVSGQLVASSDLAFLQAAGGTGIRTAVANAEPVGLFSAAEAHYLTAPYVSTAPGAEAPLAEIAPGLMISSADLRFVAGSGSDPQSLPDTWAAGADRFGIGQ